MSRYIKPTLIVLTIVSCSLAMSLNGGTESQNNVNFLQNLENENDEIEW